MIFGYSSNAFTNFTLIESIEKIAALGFGGIEIMGDRPHLYPPDFGAPAIDQVGEALKKSGLKVTNLNSFTLFAVGDTYLPSWIEPDANRRQIRINHTRSCLELAKSLACPTISVPPGGPLNGMSRKQAMELFHRGLDQVIPLAEDLGVKLLVEPEPDLLLENTSEFLSLIKNVQSASVGINFDIGHFYCAGENPAAAFETLFEWIDHVHLEDIAPTRTHHHLIPGRGAIDFKDVLQTMARLNYTGDISLELYTYKDNPEQAGMESLDYLRPIFAENGFSI